MTKTYQDTDITAMNEAIKLSAHSLQDDTIPSGGPFGAVIYKNGKLVAGSFNRVLENHDPSAHGEVQAIREACAVLGTWDLSGCVLYTSCEPCPMCLMTSKWANIAEIYFAADRNDAADIGFKDAGLYELIKPGTYGTQIKECHKDAVKVMHQWMDKFGNNGKY